MVHQEAYMTVVNTVCHPNTGNCGLFVTLNHNLHTCTILVRCMTISSSSNKLQTTCSLQEWPWLPISVPTILIVIPHGSVTIMAWLIWTVQLAMVTNSSTAKVDLHCLCFTVATYYQSFLVIVYPITEFDGMLNAQNLISCTIISVLFPRAPKILD
jgi:hypothetical protein